MKNKLEKLSSAEKRPGKLVAEDSKSHDPERCEGKSPRGAKFNQESIMNEFTVIKEKSSIIGKKIKIRSQNLSPIKRPAEFQSVEKEMESIQESNEKFSKLGCGLRVLGRQNWDKLVLKVKELKVVESQQVEAEETA